MFQLDEVKLRLSKARELLLCGEFEGEDYRTIKSESNERMANIEAKPKTSISFSDSMESLWHLPISKISHPDMLFQNGTVIHKRKIVSTLFPDNITFDGVKLHSTRVCTAINLLTKSRKNSKTNAAKSIKPCYSESVHLNRKHAVATLRDRVQFFAHNITTIN